MSLQVRIETADAAAVPVGMLAQLAQSDPEQVKREVEQDMLSTLALSISFGIPPVEHPDSTQKSGQEELVTIEFPDGPVTRDRNKFTPAQEAYYQAGQHMRRRDWQRAIEALHETIRREPPPLPLYGTHVMLGMAYFQVGDTNKAIETFRRATELNSTNEMAHLFLGTMLMLSNRFEEAVDPLEEALRRGGRASHVNFYLGYVYSQLERWDDAVKAYEAEISSNPALAALAYDYLSKLHYKLAQTNKANRERHLKDAVDVLRRWSIIDPQDAWHHNLRGYLLNDLGDYEAAVDAYEKALEIEPDNVIFLTNIGGAYLNAGRDADARRALQRVIKHGQVVMREQMAPFSHDLDDDVRIATGEAYQLLGAACLRLYQSQERAEGVTPDLTLLDEAEAAYKAALTFNPDDVFSHFNLGNLYYLTNRRAAAAKMYARAVEIEPDNQDAADNLRAVHDELEKRRRWLEHTVGRRTLESTEENPLYTEDLIDTIANAREKLYEGVDPSYQNEAFSPEDLLNAMLPIAEWLGESTGPEARLDFAARIFSRGWLPSDEAAKLAGVDLHQFLTGVRQNEAASADLEALVEEKLKQRLLKMGLLKEIKEPITDFTPYQNRTPIVVHGKPVSETILEDRG